MSFGRKIGKHFKHLTQYLLGIYSDAVDAGREDSPWFLVFVKTCLKASDS